MSSRASTDTAMPRSIAVDLALTGVSVAVALTLTRLFSTGDFLPRLLLSVGCAHLIAAVLRRLGVPVALAIIASLLLGGVVISQLYLRNTTSFGLPTSDTFSALSAELESAFGPFRRLVAPVDAAIGFQLTLAIAMWITATFADAALGRADAPVQAVTPTLAVFLFGSVLTRGDRVALSTLAVATMLALLWLAVVDRRARRRPWVRGDMADGLASNRTWGLVALGSALVAVAVTAPILPASSTDAAVDLRRIGMGDGPQVVDSPLVGLTSLLGQRSNDEMFTVNTTTDHYWRLTALDDFDGDTWSSRRRYRDIDSGSALVDGSSGAATEKHGFRITGLQSSWLPVAYEPTAIQIDTDIRYDGDSGSLLVSDRTAPGLTYRVESLILDPDNPATRGNLDPPDETALALPDDVRQLLRGRASDIIGDADSSLDQALALERFFRNEANGFEYDERVDYRGEPVPVVAFLDARAGFCQQYAGTFAALARSIGLPSRVAVGFTFGEASPDGTQRVVRGRHAHAWPEVFIANRGWLAFEPTPGRGNPDAESYTQRPAQQNDGGSGVGGTTGSTTTTVAAAPTTLAPGQATVPGFNPSIGENVGGAAPAPKRPWWRQPWWIAMATVALGGLVVTTARWLVVRRRRRDPADADPDARVRHAWQASCHDLRTVGLVAAQSESPQEFAGRAAGYAGEPIIELSRLESDRRYRPEPVSDDEADRAATAANDVRSLVVSSLGRVDRARFELDLPVH